MPFPFLPAAKNLFRVKAAISAFTILIPISLAQSLFLLNTAPRYRNSLNFSKTRDPISVLSSFSPSSSIIFVLSIFIFRPILLAARSSTCAALSVSTKEFSKIFRSSAKPSTCMRC
ncbi:Uncharacterized protein FWK35_00005292 [Aphis craccivora]|uniref:Uncharacterized protein n=1 Tax=Aphis craccivora TaxID=307492 RepID=A0A6G0ZPW9_APHCR|nr:Uncharacterized protein FWK35_00005292 [Aphis craccivora]